jgi:hypothetical protein
MLCRLWGLVWARHHITHQQLPPGTHSGIQTMAQSCMCVVLRAGVTSANIREAIQSAASLGFSSQQLMDAAVQTMSNAAQPTSPSNESPEDRRLRLLVSHQRTHLRGFGSMSAALPGRH